MARDGKAGADIKSSLTSSSSHGDAGLAYLPRRMKRDEWAMSKVRSMHVEHQLTAGNTG